MLPSRLGGLNIASSYDCPRRCFGGSGNVFGATAFSAPRPSVRPMVFLQSSSRTFLGDTSGPMVAFPFPSRPALRAGLGVSSSFCACSFCSRASHFANAEFFFTGLSLRSRFVGALLTNGSAEESYPLSRPVLCWLESLDAFLLTVPCRLGTDEPSVLLFEIVDRVWRSGDDFVGEWSLKRLCGGDVGEPKRGA